MRITTAIVLLLTASGLNAAGSTPSPQAANPPLPQGHTGIASRFPNDANIASDPDVIFADDFESYGTASNLTTRWNEAYHLANLKIETAAANVFAGSKSLGMTVPAINGEVSNTAIKYVNPTLDVLFLRYYAKFDSAFNVLASSHNGSTIQSKYCCPGVPANGTNKWLVSYEAGRNSSSDPNPGKLNVYIYHPEQRDIWGDHFYPTGIVSPFTSTPYNFGTDFVSRPNVTPTLGAWHSYEVMVKANTPGMRDGRIALWYDGQLIADFMNLRLRDTTALKIDKFTIDLHVNGTTTSAAKKWYDNVVAAKSYIGPVYTGPAPSLPTVTVSATDGSAGEPSNAGVFTIARTGSTTNPLTVNFAVSGTATSGSDYTALGTSVTIPAGSASATKTVTPADDSTVESSETVILTLSNNAAYTVVSPSSATVTIADNDVVDTDGDGVPDLEESRRGTNPLDPLSFFDNDLDGVPDVSDPDIDNDGIPNGSDPDRDGDGATDSAEVTAGTDPGDRTSYPGDLRDNDQDGTANGQDLDDDNDGLPDLDDPDRDGDGWGNGEEIQRGSDPNDRTSVPSTDDSESSSRACGATGAELVLLLAILALRRRTK